MATNRIGPQLLLGTNISLADEPYNRVLSLVKNVRPGRVALNNLFEMAKVIEPHKLERDFDQNVWPIVFGEIVFILESLADHLDITFRKFHVDYDSCIYQRVTLFDHITMLKSEVAELLPTSGETDEKYYNEVYKNICYEMS